jgi:octaprenyl-diphosphate synthase
MEKLIERYAAHSMPGLRAVGQHILGSHGKHLRPALLLFSAEAALPLGQKAPRARLGKLAASVELLHVASLVHDDFIDGARQRRNLPTVNAKWGGAISVAVGDYLYASAMRLTLEAGTTEIMHCFARAIQQIAEGEMLQILNRGNEKLSRRLYLDIIRKKTAALFAASCRTGALAVGADARAAGALESFGRSFGMAFQILDDLRDLDSEGGDLGKHRFQDVIAGDMTLPLLELFRRIPRKESRRLVSRLLSEKKGETGPSLRETLERTGVSDSIRVRASGYRTRARKALCAVPESPSRHSLEDLLESACALQ